MRIAGYIEHPTFKITIMHMNHRYALKFEYQGLEQTYKLRESNAISSPNDIKQIVTEEVLNRVTQTFKDMNSTKLHMLQFGWGDTETEEFEDII